MCACYIIQLFHQAYSVTGDKGLEIKPSEGYISIWGKPL